MIATSSRKLTWTVPAVLLSVLLAPVATSGAQTDSEGFFQMKFNFLPPGARATALGGAFIALADDATAAESNPAGLTVLLYPQLSFESKFVRFGRPTPIGLGNAGPDLGPVNRSPAKDVYSPAFASAVYPAGGVTFAAFRHEVMNFPGELAYGFHPPDFPEIEATATSLLTTRVANYGVAVARRFGSVLSIGIAGGASVLTMSQDLHYVIAVTDPDFVTDSRWTTLGDDGRKYSAFATAGVMLRFGERVALGGVYKYRQKFTGLRENNVAWVRIDGQVTRAEPTTKEFSFNLPDAAGVGFSARLTDRFTIAADAELIRYSELSDWLDENINNDPSLDLFEAKDGIDGRLGAELVVSTGPTPFALRAGVGRFASTEITQTTRSGEDAGTRTGEHEATYTGNFGFGTVVARRFQLDAAVAIGKDLSVASLSLVYFFGRQ